LIRAILFLPFWWLERLIPRDKHIFVFGSWYGLRYSDNSKALFEYILNNEPQFKPYWITHDKNVYKRLRSENKPVVMGYSFKGWWICQRTSVAFITNGVSDVNRYALNGARYIWLWHGMPLKKIRADNKDSMYYPDEKRLYRKIILLIIKYLLPYNYFKNIVSATISSSDFFLPYLKSAFLIQEKKVWLTGLPRTDFSYCNKTEIFIDRLKRDFSNSSIILYMPTFRIEKGKPYNPFNEQSFNNELFLDFLNKCNIIFLYKAHFHDRTFNFSLSSKRFMILNDSDYDELYVLISNIDILITDYSSVYFDFLCLNKPAILTPFDYDFYIREAREHYFDYNLLPSIKAYNWDELMNIIAEKKYYSLSKEEADKFCKYNDGHASERCLQKTLEMLNEVT
jgi:CDP-glycerol glycerophosphotransferase